MRAFPIPIVAGSDEERIKLLRAVGSFGSGRRRARGRWLSQAAAHRRRKALKAAPPAWERWRELSYSHQRKYVEAIEEAKKAETRARRVDGAVRLIAERPAKKRK